MKTLLPIFKYALTELVFILSLRIAIHLLLYLPKSRHFKYDEFYRSLLDTLIFQDFKFLLDQLGRELFFEVLKDIKMICLNILGILFFALPHRQFLKYTCR